MDPAYLTNIALATSPEAYRLDVFSTKKKGAWNQPALARKV